MFRLKIVLTLLFVSLFLLSGCTRDSKEPFVCQDPLGCVILAPGEPVKIVSMQALTGELGPLGQENVNIARLAAAQWGGDIHGHPLVIIAEDERCTREGGYITAQKIASNPQIVAVHGGTCSISSIPAAEIFSRAGLSMISGSATAPSLTSFDGQPGEHWHSGFFRTAPNDKFMGYAVAYFSINDLAITRAATVNDGDPYTRSLVELFELEYRKIGGETVFSGGVTRGDQNMAPLLHGIEMSGAGMLFFPIFSPEADYIVNQVATMSGLKDLVLVGADGLVNEPFIKKIRDINREMYFVTPYMTESHESRKLYDDYADMFGQTIIGTFYGHHYDAARMLFQALENTAFINDEGSLVIGRHTLQEEICSLKGFNGLTGRLSCNRFGDCGIPKYKLIRLDNPQATYLSLSKNIISTFEPGADLNCSEEQ